MVFLRSALVLSGFLGLCACATPSEPAPHAYSGAPAVLASPQDENVAALQIELGEILGRANIVLGADDPTASPLVTVLPPPLNPNETHSVAMPVTFQLKLIEHLCYARQTDTGEEFALETVTCIPYFDR